MLRRSALFVGMIVAAFPAWTASYYTVRLDDPKAVYLTKDSFPVHADGVADDTEAIQQAIDKASGVVFVPEGRYRITSTITVWAGIRVIGYGANRPVFVLGENTPGYQDKSGEKYMVFFSGGRAAGGRGAPVGQPGGGRAQVAPPAGGAPGFGGLIAAGQIYAYNPAGQPIDTIEVPERPIQLVFGGKDGQTLFIAARTSLYAVRVKVKGR